jgi:hypothetical protein
MRQTIITSPCPAFRTADPVAAAHNTSDRRHWAEAMASELRQWSDFEFRITWESYPTEKQV